MEQLILLSIGILSALMAFAVLFQDPKNNVNRLFFVNSIMLFVWTSVINLFILSQNPAESILIFRVYIISTVLAPLALIALGNNFPIKNKKQPIALYIIVGLFSTILAIWSNVILSSVSLEDFDFYGQNNPAIIDQFIGFSAVFIQIGINISAWFGLLRLKKYKNRLKGSPIYTTITITIFLAVILSTIFNLIAVVFWHRYDLSSTLGNFSVCLLLTAYAIGIWKFSFYDSRSALLKTFSYAGAEIAIITTYYLFREIIGANNPEEVSRFSVAVGVFSTAILVMAFAPIADFLNYLLRKTFDKSKSIDIFLKKLNTTLAQNTDLETLLKKLSYDVSGVISARNVSFYVRYGAEKDKFFLVGKDRSSNLPHKDVQALDGLTKEYDEMFITAASLIGEDREDDYRMFKSHGWSMIVPLRTNVEIVGFMLVGYPKGVRFRHSDLNILQNVYNSVMIAINSAISTYNVRDINNTLEQRIKNATKDLRRANQHLRRADESKDEFISMASHQLRTPLTSIKGYISMILDGDAGSVTKMQKTFLSEAFASSDRMVHIINDFLNVSRLQTGKFVLDKTTGNLESVVKEEIEGLESSANSRGLKVKLTSEGKTPVFEADFDKLRQVVMNMIDNAIYYSKPDQTIKISLTNTEDRIIFKVVDKGIGVPKDEQDGLFGKFYRTSNARRQRPDGTGVGLFLARKVVLDHKGDVIFESEEGQGSIFGFWIPIKK